MPISRYLEWLETSGNLEGYLHQLVRPPKGTGLPRSPGIPILTLMAKGIWRRWRDWVGADAVRTELLRGDSPGHLSRRRRIGLSSSVGTIASLLVGLHQMGVLRRLPEPPGRLWDSRRVTRSPAAFVMGVPDGPVGALAFSAIVVLAARLAARPPAGRPWTARLLGALTAGSALGAGLYLYDMAAKEKRLCPYCLTTAAVSFALVPLSWPELRHLVQAGRSG